MKLELVAWLGMSLKIKIQKSMGTQLQGSKVDEFLSNCI